MRKVLDFPTTQNPTFNSAYLASPRPLTKTTRANSTSPDLHSLHSPRSREESVTLPHIQTGEKLAKFNEVRNQTSRGKQNVILLEARLKALRKEKEKNQKETEWAKQKIEFITTIRNRCDEDDKRKKQEKHKRDLENAYLKKKADEFKETHKSLLQQTFTTLNTRKAEQGKSIRSMTRINQQQIHLIKQTMQEENRMKKQEIKQMQAEIENELKEFEEKRKQRARSNHLRRVAEQMQRRHKTYKILSKLNNQEEMLLDQLKMSETTKIAEFRNLKKVLYDDEKQTQPNSSRRNKSVYTGMFRKVIDEIDNEQSEY